MFYPTTCVRLRYGPDTDMLSSFSREHTYVHYRLTHAFGVLSSSALPVDLPAGIDAYTLQPAIPSAGGAVTSPSPRHSIGQ